MKGTEYELIGEKDKRAKERRTQERLKDKVWKMTLRIRI